MHAGASLLELVERGPYPVGVASFTLQDGDDPERQLPTDVWYPADTAALAALSSAPAPASHPFGRPHAALDGAPPAPGPFPLVAFSHGNSGLRRQSTYLTTHLASHGFVVVAPDHTGNTFPEMLNLPETRRKEVHLAIRQKRPADLRAAIDLVVKQPKDARLPEIDVERIGALGHSFGGWTALKMPRLDAHVRAVCGLAPASEPFVGRKAFEPDELPLANGVPCLLVAAADDVLVDVDASVRPLFARLAAPRGLVLVRDADHFHFCDGIALLHGMHAANPRALATRATRPTEALLDEARMHRAVAALVTAFFTATLASAGDAARWFDALTPEALALLDPALAHEPASA